MTAVQFTTASLVFSFISMMAAMILAAADEIEWTTRCLYVSCCSLVAVIVGICLATARVAP